MSVTEEKQVACPQCGQEQSITLWKSLNVAQNPEEKPRLYNGEINLLVCNKCGHKSFVPTPLLYHDLDRRIAVQYFPPAYIRRPEFIQQFNRDGSFAPGDALQVEVPDYLRQLHIVFNMNELVTYVIFRDVLAEYHQTGKVMLN